ncbi:MAG TPA: 16S rRNA (cytidine(1402)-2'-O)-methyltransferase [Candidatus Flavonifractor merdigallinarum]|uniref:Ribosomal RNA small subunit methyltransferase I n=1 Tax=Candidatus Flavonifractor merdigallinarum TaxID=2838589 RepID=A0A9D1Y710_9FIRM|nr:16S rRNA (cytidine(1402)-2'-O)-methyltransferase [Candidatus Flavonifractor merdigallinarum]
MAGTLYLVPTPIGNLGDISRRMVETLSSVDFIAAEDTRVSVKLLNHLDIKKPMVIYHRHNADTSGPAIVQRLLAGESCALVTDAGTPAISDPGEDLVALCAGAEIPVVSIPGPCALITALSVSGLPTGRFTFEGFLPMNKKNRRAHLDALRREERTMLFYEAPHKLAATLADLRETFGGDRRITLCRELTKLHEEVVRTTLDGAVERCAHQSPKGEYVLVLAGCPPVVETPPSLEAGVEKVYVLRGKGISLRDAVKQVSKELGLPRNELYAAAVTYKDSHQSELHDTK